MKTTMFTILMMAFSFFAFAQKNATIRIESVTVKVNGQEFKGGPVNIPLEIKDKTLPTIIYSDGDLVITATYKLFDVKSYRSQSKSSSIKFKIEYTCKYKGKKVERKVERMFFLNDQRAFDEKDTFVITDGIKNFKIELMYTGVLQD